MCDTSRSHTAIVTLILGGVYDLNNSIPSTKLPVASQRSCAWSEAIEHRKGGMALRQRRGRADGSSSHVT